jgi:hypothetical protein
MCLQVAFCKGPTIPMRVGRVDAAAPDPEGRLPALTFTSQQLKDNFAEKGLSAKELVVLSGAHTIGRWGCVTLCDCVSCSMRTPLEGMPAGACVEATGLFERWMDGWMDGCVDGWMGGRAHDLGLRFRL